MLVGLNCKNMYLIIYLEYSLNLLCEVFDGLISAHLDTVFHIITLWVDNELNDLGMILNREFEFTIIHSIDQSILVYMYLQPFNLEASKMFL